MAVDVDELHATARFVMGEINSGRGDDAGAEIHAAADEIERLRAEAERLTVERDAALARLAPHEALVAELRERATKWYGVRAADAQTLLARHGLGGDA